jgi:hypothetical protein
MALGSTQPLTEMSTRNISWGRKGGRCVQLTTLPLACADFHEIWEAEPSEKPQDLSRPIQGLLYLYLLLKDTLIYLRASFLTC